MFCAYTAQISGKRLQDHLSSGFSSFFRFFFCLLTIGVFDNTIRKLPLFNILLYTASKDKHHQNIIFRRFSFTIFLNRTMIL